MSQYLESAGCGYEEYVDWSSHREARVGTSFLHIHFYSQNYNQTSLTRQVRLIVQFCIMTKLNISECCEMLRDHTHNMVKRQEHVFYPQKAMFNIKIIKQGAYIMCTTTKQQLCSIGSLTSKIKWHVSRYDHQGLPWLASDNIYWRCSPGTSFQLS